MPSPTKTPVTPEGLPVDSQRGLRRVVLGSSIGTSVLLALILAFTGPGETTPAAATPPGNAQAEVMPGAETYPVPSQAAGENSPVIAPIAVDREAAPTAPPDQQAPPARKADSDASKAARNHVTAHKPIAAARLDARTLRGHGTIAAGAAPTHPEVFPKSDAGVAAPGPEIKKRVPLVDEPSRVQILE